MASEFLKDCLVDHLKDVCGELNKEDLEKIKNKIQRMFLKDIESIDKLIKENKSICEDEDGTCYEVKENGLVISKHAVREGAVRRLFKDI